MKNNRMIHLQSKFTKEKGFLISLFLLLFLTGCQTTLQPQTEQETFENYLSVNKGSYSYYVTKINLDSPELQIICKIDTKDFFDLQDFAEQSGAAYAINTTPFAYDENKNAYLLGVTKFNNQLYSSPVEKYSALGFYFDSNNKIRAKVIQNQTEDQLKAFPTAFGGYFTILKDSEIIEYKDIKHSRTACGIDESGQYLYFLTVVSNLVLDNSGLSYQECAEILKALGCTDALQFDGGHSTSFISPQSGYVHSKYNWKIPAAFGIFVK